MGLKNQIPSVSDKRAQQITVREKIYLCLCLLFSTLIIIGNLVYQKFTSLPFFLYHFEISVGAILYPFTFLLTDLIAEFYGKEAAKFCIKVALYVNSFMILLMVGLDALPATVWSKVSKEEFHHVFGNCVFMFAGSAVAAYISQNVDIKLYLAIKKITRGKLLWLRNNLSTGISLCVDTFIVLSLMVILNILPIKQLPSLFINSYLFKLFFTLCSTPIFYFGVFLIRSVFKKTQPEK